MYKTTIGLVAMAACLVAAPNDKERREANERLAAATSTLTEIMSAGDKGIPQDLMDKAHCAVVVPGLKKGAFIVGGQFGKGFISCRNDGNTGWSAPAAIRVEGGSVGFQIGGSETDVVMLVMNRRGADRLMGDQFTLGGEGEVAAGPVGRNASAQTDAKLSAEMLSWSRSRGVFAGISLKGTTFRPDRHENEALYGSDMGTRDVVSSHVPESREGRAFTAALTGYSPVEKP